MILWKNGIFHSLENASHSYHQMVTHQGLIVSFDDDISHIDFDQIVDLKGAHLYPGFVDSHLHMMGYGQRWSRPSLLELKNVDDMIAVIRQHPDDIIFEGYMSDHFDKVVLDQLFKKRPIVLRHTDYHAATVNTAVLNDLGLTSEDGCLKETDAMLAMNHYSHHSMQTLEQMFSTAIKKLYTFGVTGGHTDDLAYFNGFDETFKAINNVLIEMPFRAHLLINHHVLDEYLDAKLKWLDLNDYLQLGAIKIFYDGTFSSMTARVSIPYVNGTHGLTVLNVDELDTLIQKIRDHGLTLAIHVIGDIALSEVFSLLEKYPAPKGLHDRIIHASMWQSKEIQRAQKLPLIFDIQPQFIRSDIPHILQLFKTQRFTLYPWHTLMKHHLLLCGGSDAPVEIPNPLRGMYDAVYRETEDGIYDYQECLTRYEALKLYTSNANIPTYHHNRGYLRKGYIADFSILQDDILTIAKERFIANKVMMTVIHDHIVYKG